MSKKLDTTLGEYHAKRAIAYSSALGRGLRVGQTVTCEAYVARALGLKKGPAPAPKSKKTSEPAPAAEPDAPSDPPAEQSGQDPEPTQKNSRRARGGSKE